VAEHYVAHVQRSTVASTTAKEITHEDVEMVRRFGAAFLTVVFELPLSDVTVVDGETAVLECRGTITPAAEVTWYVDTSFMMRGLRAGTDYCPTKCPT